MWVPGIQLRLRGRGSSTMWVPEIQLRLSGRGSASIESMSQGLTMHAWLVCMYGYVNGCVYMCECVSCDVSAHIWPNMGVSPPLRRGHAPGRGVRAPASTRAAGGREGDLVRARKRKWRAPAASLGGEGGARGETHSRITPDYRWGVRNATRPR